MKFSDIDERRWPELKTYLDTCLLPVTQLSGSEPPFAAAKALEALRDLLDAVEIPFHGRVVTYPAVHYAGEDAGEKIGTVCACLREAGFRHVIAACRMKPPPGLREDPDGGASLLISAADYSGKDPDTMRTAIRGRIIGMWERGRR